MRVAATTSSPFDSTATKSLFPITEPPVQVLPWSELVNNPDEVAASQRLGVTSISLTRASRTERTTTAGTFAAFVLFLPFTTRAADFSVTMVLIGRHWLAL